MLTDEDKKFFVGMMKPDRRFGPFKLQEWVLFGTFLFGAGINFAAFVDLKESTKWLTAFARNSDGYHSAVLGTQFEQGKPANPAYDTTGARNRLAPIDPNGVGR